MVHFMKSSATDPKSLLSCCVAAARTAGMHALKNYSRRRKILKSFQHDVKLELDIECQAKAEAVIRKCFPDHPVLGEESPDHGPIRNPPDSYEWIIDPIDGTVNFSHGLPFWCCSVAVRKGEHSVAGAVFAPELNSLYTATTREPSAMNGSRIKVSGISALAGSIILTGLDKKKEPGHPPFALFETIAGATQKARIMGSAALDLCLVASGCADGYFETGIYLWDIAAGSLIVRQAGGKAEVLEKRDGYRIKFLATNGLIHSSLKKILKAAPANRSSR